MATNFPTSLDTFTNPNSGNTLDSPSHSIQHSDINDAVEAIEAKIGVGSSTAGSATAGYALVNTSGGTTAYSLLGVSGLSSGTAVANTFLRANGSGAATFAPTAQGLTLLIPSSVAVGSGTGTVSATGTVDFSGASPVSINDVFSATYNNYRIIIALTDSSVLTNVFFRFRVSGSDNSNASYNYMFDGYTQGGGSVPFTAAGATQLNLYQRTASDKTTASDLTCILPFATATTLLMGPTTAENNSNFYSGSWGGNFDVTTSFTGFSVIGESGTLTGSISVYGINK